MPAGRFGIGITWADLACKAIFSANTVPRNSPASKPSQITGHYEHRDHDEDAQHAANLVDRLDVAAACAAEEAEAMRIQGEHGSVEVFLAPEAVTDGYRWLRSRSATEIDGPIVLLSPQAVKELRKALKRL